MTLADFNASSTMKKCPAGTSSAVGSISSSSCR
jgi:hypothetical protein